MQSIEAENLAQVKRLITGLATGDWRAVRDVLADNVVFHFPGANAFAGDYRGREPALEMLAKVAQWTAGSMRVKLHDILVNEQHGVLLYTVSAKRGEKAVSYRYVDVYHFRDGQITEVWGSAPDQQAFDDFFAE